MSASFSGKGEGRRAWVPLATLALALVTQAGRAQLPHWEGQPPPAPSTQLSPTEPAPLAVPAPPPAQVPLPAGDSQRSPLEASWADGLRFTSPDDQFRLHVGGNAQIDSTWLSGPNSVFLTNGGSSNGIGNAAATFIRRARLRVDGDIYDQFDFVVEYNFANADNENDGVQPPSFSNLSGSPAPGNVWMQIRDVPVLGNVRIGYQVKPIGMSNNTSQTNLPFLERPDSRDAFYGPFDNGFAIGISARNHTDSERITWQYGVYRPLTNAFGVALNKVVYGGRATALPWYEDAGERLMHVGMGVWAGEVVQDELRLRARPVLRNGPGFAVPILADTGEIPGSRQAILAPELAFVLGPWTFQAEWTGQYLTQAVAPNGQQQGTAFFQGGYAEVLYFITGEHQQYERREGVFGRVVPKTNYRWKKGMACEGCGAWQVGARFSYLDLNDKAIQGGRLYDWTFGLNWFLNPNMKIQLNYILERRDAPTDAVSGWVNGVGVRAAYDF
jgi:phosphate-selective porin OprO/OprP